MQFNAVWGALIIVGALSGVSAATVEGLTATGAIERFHIVAPIALNLPPLQVENHIQPAPVAFNPTIEVQPAAVDVPEGPPAQVMILPAMPHSDPLAMQPKAQSRPRWNRIRHSGVPLDDCP